jgi:methyl-accepting chemotaxis protein
MNTVKTGIKNLGVSGKILLITTVTIILIIGVQTWLSIRFAIQESEQAEELHLITLYDDYNDEVVALEKASATLSLSFADRPDIQELFMAQDRDGLLALLSPLFGTLKEEYNIRHLYVEDTDGKVFVRVHNPAKFGDDVTYRLTAAAALDSRQTVAGVEIGPGRLGVRSVSPMFHQGDFIGMAEVGLDYDQAFIDNLSSQNNADYKMWISRDAAAAAGLGPEDGAPVSPVSEIFFYAGTNSTLLPVPVESYHRVMQSGEAETLFISDGDQDLNVLIAPLLGYGNQSIGILEIATSRAESLADLRQNEFTSLAMALGLALLALVTVWGMSKIVLSRPLELLTEAAVAISGGDLSQKANVSSQDELGQLANTFNIMADNLSRRIQAENNAREQAAHLADAERERRESLEQTTAKYLAFVERVSDGDLTARLSLNGESEEETLVRLGHNLNRMVESLGEMTQQFQEATANITSAAAEIMASSSQQTSGVSEQSSAISQTSTTIDEVKAIVEQSQTKADLVAQQAGHTSEISHIGQQAVTDTIESMNLIKERVAGIAENILTLSERTQQIGDIITVVNDIASQSNLLALNASVEAARAGEHGKGFNVVAVEVRNLAEQSKQATAQVKEILNEIQRATNAAVMVTEEGAKGVDEGVRQTEQTGETIEQLATSIGESARAAQQIMVTAQQQTTGMEQISLAMQNIDQTTIQNLASIRQAEKAAHDLSSLARQMETLVARYKLD